VGDPLSARARPPVGTTRLPLQAVMWKEDRARSMEDVLLPWKPPAAMSLPDLMSTVTVALEGKAYKYGMAQCRGLDALVYVNLTATRFLHPLNAPSEVSRLRGQGWRSVSLLFPPYRIVACASASAPGFLRSIAGQVRNAWSDPQNLFRPARQLTT
jgi:hypothetical protein